MGIKNKHLDESDRKIIEERLNECISFKKIALEINKNCSTISKEVRNHIQEIKPSSFNNNFNRCSLKSSCKLKNVCGKNCDKLCKNCKLCNNNCINFTKEICEKLNKPPYVCNGCSNRKHCRMVKYVYKAKDADLEYKNKLSFSRQGIDASKEEIKQLSNIITPLIKNGQTPAIIKMNNPDIKICEKTIYNYIDQGVFEDISNIDLPRKVSYKPRNKNIKKEPRNDTVRIGRTYLDYQNYKEAHPLANIVELDTVEGIKGGKCLLTMIFTKCNFMIAFLIDSQTKLEVTDKFKIIKRHFGDKYLIEFEIILTDNGKEFKDVDAIEKYDDKNKIHLFYCDPGASYQKPHVENNHTLIRRILPKGSSFDDLTQDDVYLIMSHINSTPRDELNGNTPYELAALLIGEDIIKNFCNKVDRNKVILKPKLLIK